jgi:serine/threonine-protein phosphatase 2A activator
MEATVGRQLAAILQPANREAAAAELAPYLVDSFGNRTRIDYGTGHEMTFVMFVCGLFKVGFLGPKDMVPVGLKVFAAYFDLGELGGGGECIVYAVRYLAFFQLKL